MPLARDPSAVSKIATAPGTAARLGLGIALAAILATTLGIRVVGAAFLGDETPAIEVSGPETFELAGLMPGDARQAAVIGLKAGGSITYRMRVEWTGSGELARQLTLTLTNSAGSVLYRGSLAEARVGGNGWTSELDRRLGDGQVDSIVANAQLPLDATNDVQGAAVTAHLVLEMTENAG
jgi:hypothetical protein